MKKWSVWHQLAPFDVQNDEFVAGLPGLVSAHQPGLVPAHLPWSHFQFMRTQFAFAVLWFEQFLKIYISQGSSVTHFKCDGIFNDSFISNFPECASEGIFKIRWKLTKLSI